MAIEGALPAIFGCAGPVLTHTEREFFRDNNPVGFILFHRNVADPAQVQSLTQQLRDAVGRAAPILIDQEGGRVQRLRPPLWREAPAAGSLGALAKRDLAEGRRAAWLNGRLLAADLLGVGIDVDCAPVLDVPAVDGHAIIGDRAFASDPEIVAALGRATADGLLAGGVLPVIKHIPGHGRATLDSHEALPRVAAGEAELVASDFRPFRALADLPLAMTAHVTYMHWDEAAPATQSAIVIQSVIRDLIGFQGVLLSDDIGMAALTGGFGERAARAQRAGCDLVLHCSGDLPEITDTAAALSPLTGSAAMRVDRALAKRDVPEPADLAAYDDEMAALLATLQ